MIRELTSEDGRCMLVNINNYMWTKHLASGKAVALTSFGQVVFDISYDDIKQLLLPSLF